MVEMLEKWRHSCIFAGRKEIAMLCRKLFFVLGMAAMCGVGAGRVREPLPCGLVPSERQLRWHEMEMYAFIHFTTTTYRDIEWGYGDAEPDEFRPDSLDCDQWAATLRAAGMKGVVITAKHHDGFCLWPSKETDYSVKASSWRDGKGDVVAEMASAARRHGLLLGVYLSPWDRHDLRYGSPEYVDYFRAQLRELLTEYGPIFEVWQDGANGGDGYYGGACERRIIDKNTYYGWDVTDSLIRSLQPWAAIFSDEGPDTRWCGTESGHVGATNWCTISRGHAPEGNGRFSWLQQGEENGTDWVPAEVDVSIRPGWFYHAREDDKVKTVEQLMDIYYSSVGRGANLILNVPPMPSGRLHPTDVASLTAFGEALRREFAYPLLGKGTRIEASNVRGGSRRFAAGKLTDGRKDSYWATDDSVRAASVTIVMDGEREFNRLSLSEYLPLGQRVKAWRVEARQADGNWRQIAEGTTIGHKRLLRFDKVCADEVRISITDAKACPCISEVQLFLSEE